MDELLKVEGLMRQVRERLARDQEELHALEIVADLLRKQDDHGDDAAPVQSKNYETMNQDDAMEDVLEKAHRLMTAKEITQWLQSGRFPLNGNNPRDTVYQALKLNRKGKFSPGKKQGNNVFWGLKKWERAM
jgi:hypothetical protein